MEEFGILSLIPPIVAIILALTTKDVIISLVSSVAAGALVLAHFNPHGAFVIFWKDLFFTELTVNSWNGELINPPISIFQKFFQLLEDADFPLMDRRLRDSKLPCVIQFALALKKQTLHQSLIRSRQR